MLHARPNSEQVHFPIDRPLFLAHQQAADLIPYSRGARLTRSPIFAASRLRQANAETEFRYFRSQIREEVKKLTSSNEDYAALKAAYGLSVSFNGYDQIQIGFGKRKLSVLDLDDNQAVERGAQLVYSLGRIGGHVATVLYPAHSPLGSASEEHIFIRIGSYSGLRLLAALPADLSDLARYAFVSGIETDPTFYDRCRIWWLRLTRAKQIEGKFSPPDKLPAMVASLSKVTAVSIVVAVLKPLGVIAAGSLLAYFGLTQIEHFMK